MTDTELNNRIDRILTIFRTNHQLNGLSFITIEGWEYVIGRMHEFMLVRTTTKLTDNTTYYELTSLGYEVLAYGSWTDYQRDKQENIRLDIKLKNSTLSTNNLQKILLWGTIFFAALSVIIAYCDFIEHRKEVELLQKQDQREQEKLQQSETRNKEEYQKRNEKSDSVR